MQEPTLPPSLFVSVAVRSYRRLPQLFELLAALQRQSYPRFEIVVIEQSVAEREQYRSELARVAQDARVRVLEYPALGAGAARNEAARQARGEIVLFIDDDDLPLGDDWIRAHVDNYADPACAAVSGRHALDPLEPASDSPRCQRLCLRYSWLKMPRGRTNFGHRIVGVTQVAGTNASIRRSAIERAGGWDDAQDHDEDSFNFRFARIKAAHEYFVFDPKPVILRRLDVPGGLDRRQQTLGQRLLTELRYSHGVVRRYFPLRFWALYHVYLACAAQRAIAHVLSARRRKHGVSPSASVTGS
ncbi:MAG: glycosyltransferase [Deltaproteobacteria bacterium]